MALLQEDQDVKALVLTGSLANNPDEVDEWSDVDLRVVVSDASLGRFCSSARWLALEREILAVDHVEHGPCRTLRVCLVPFRRLDLTFVPETALQSIASWGSGLFPTACKVLWSRIPDLAERISRIQPRPSFKEVSPAEVESIGEVFWFKATIVIAKTVRNDLLVALHLALDLVRDCLVLQMMLRDRQKGTNIHRRGGPGNEIVAELCTHGRRYSTEEILDVVSVCGRVFDRLAPQLSPDYRKRWSLLEPTVSRAKGQLGGNLGTGR